MAAISIYFLGTTLFITLCYSESVRGSVSWILDTLGADMALSLASSAPPACRSDVHAGPGGESVDNLIRAAGVVYKWN